MRGRGSWLLLAGAAIVIGLLVMVWRSMGDANEPPPPPAPVQRPASPPVAAPAPTATAPTPVTPAAPSPPPGPAPHSATTAPTMPSLPELAAEVPHEKKPPIVTKAMLREQTQAVEPKLAECAAKAGYKGTGTATLTFIVAHKAKAAVIETTGVDYDKTTIDNEKLLECMRETARDMKFQPAADSDAISAIREVKLDNGKVVGNSFVDFSYVR
jgi:hypothetical protein